MKNLPAIIPPDPYDFMVAAVLDMIEDSIPHDAVRDLCVIAQDAEQFHTGMQALVELGDIIEDHYDDKGEPDDGPYDEEIDLYDDYAEDWDTDGDDFDPPDDWFDEGGPFDPNL